MIGTTGHTPDSLFGVRRDVGRPARLVARVGRPWFGADGRFRPGVLTVPLDINLGLEVYRLHRPADVTVVTTELSVDFTGRQPALGDELIVEGEPVSANDNSALSVSRIADHTGALLATASASTRFVPRQATHATMARDIEDFPAPECGFDELFAGSFDRREGTDIFEAECTKEHTNARGTLQGGLIAATAEWVASVQFDAERWACQSIRASFLRPVPGRTKFTVRVKPRFDGRRFAVIDASVESGGRVCALVRVGLLGAESTP